MLVAYSDSNVLELGGIPPSPPSEESERQRWEFLLSETRNLRVFLASQQRQQSFEIDMEFV
jgi:hypothetical protein